MKRRKKIVFFYNGQKDLDEGYACEALREEWHLNTEPATELVDISSGIPSALQCDLMIVEDGVAREVAEGLLPAALKVDEIESIAVCYGGTILSKLIDSLQEPPKVMTLDFELQDFGDISHGAISKTEELYSRICNNPKWRETVIIGITNHSRVAFSKQLVALLRRRNDLVLPKKQDLWAILPDILWDCLNRHKVRLELAQLEAKLLATQHVAHSDNPLFENTRHLVGIENIICELAEKLEAFFMWETGEWELCPEEDRPKFVSCLLLEGEPGCAKTDICKAIVTTFGNEDDSFLPKDLGPNERPKGWQKLLQSSLIPLYKKAATKDQVVVIVGDDLAWPDVGTMQAADMAGEWQAYMQAVRDCIKDADKINRGQEPSVPWIKSISTAWKGRIVWLLAKNSAQDAGQAYRPLVEFMSSFRLQFPRDDSARRQILEGYATRHKMKFAPEAVELATKHLSPPAYGGREFVGDESSGKGFAYWCVERVKKLSRAAKASGSSAQRVISVGIVQEWLNTAQHKAVVGDQAPTGNPPIGAKGLASAKRALLKEEIREELKKYEAACSGVTGKITLEAIGKARGFVSKTGKARWNEVSKFFSIREPNMADGRLKAELVQELDKEKPQQWPKLRILKQFNTLLTFRV